MAVLVRNETGSNWYFTSTNKRGQGDKFIAPNAIVVLSDLEWAEVAITKRGPGNLNPLSPSLDDAEVKSELEYFDSGFGTTELHYLGKAHQQALTSDAVWTVKKFAYSQITAGDVRIIEIQIMMDVAWDDRASLAWT